MCGINGFNWEDRRLLKSMNGALRHRGPDDEGTYTTSGLSFGQVRLSIIDLSPAGHQPMFYSKRYGACSETHLRSRITSAALSIVFNGEIYNFQGLRDELAAKGYAFSTKSDTEIILAAYVEWGFDCVNRFNGMWAFCIHDKRKHLLFCSRDRLGVKPFYYYLKDRRFVFSSELKGIIAHKRLKINRSGNIHGDAVSLYFALGFIPAPKTIFNDVFKLEASHNLVFDLRKRQITNYWRYYDIPPYEPINNKKMLIAGGRALLKDAVRLRMISDVPVGAFLSGGLDSSTVVGEMRELTDISKLHTFSIGFDGKYDETKYMEIVKAYFKTQHHHQYFTEQDFEKILRDYAQIYDEPFGDYSCFPTYTVSELARKYVTVCLSGDGGDEIFGGYSNHVMGHRMDLIRRLPELARKLGAKLPAKKNLNGFASAYLLREAFRISLEHPSHFHAETLKEDAIRPEAFRRWATEKLGYAYERSGGRLSEALRIHDLAFNTLADNFLTKVDRASMAHALEVRSPFLDYRFVAYAQRIPAKWKVDSFKTKKLMREIIKDIVPPAIAKRGKQGFTPPLKEWILQQRYASRIKAASSLLKQVDPELHAFFQEKILKETNALYTEYRIRLFLFGEWWKRWVV